MATWQQRLNPAMKARRRRLLAKIHIEAAEYLAPTGDWRCALRNLVVRITRGRAKSCGDCMFDELGAVLDHLMGRPARKPKFRDRISAGKPGGTLSQADYVRNLSRDVSALHPDRGGGEFGDVLLTAKIGTADPELMTPNERRGAINILKSYLGRTMGLKKG